MIRISSSRQARAACVEIIERFYSPTYQRIVIHSAVSGMDADDLLYLKLDENQPA